MSLSQTNAAKDELFVEIQVERVTRATLQAVARYDVRSTLGIFSISWHQSGMLLSR